MHGYGIPYATGVGSPLGLSLAFFKGIPHFSDMLGQGSIRAEGTEKVVGFFGILVSTADIRLQMLVAHDDLVVISKFLDFRHQASRVDDVQNEHTEKHPHHKGKCLIAVRICGWIKK